MRKLSVILILIFTGVSYSQVYPSEFKIVTPLFIVKQNNINDNTPKVLGRFSVAPENSQTIISNFISDIIVVENPVSDTIWFGTGKGISRTTNYGISFQNYYGIPPFGEDDVSGIAVYKNWVVVATANSKEVNDETVPFGTGIKVSSDFGQTWSAHPQPVDAQNDSSITYGISHIYALPITAVEQNLSYDILVTKKNNTSDSIVIWITSWAGEFRKSTDYGATFKRVVLPPDNLDSISPGGGPYTFELNPRNPPQGNDNHKCFSVCAENDSTIYVGTAGGINKSTDRGVSWRKSSFSNTGAGSGISGNFVVALKIQRYSNNKIVWGATNVGGEDGGSGGQQFSAVSFTSNSGTSWGNTLEEGTFSHNLGFKDSIVYAATDDGIWRSFFTPANFSWSKPSVIYDELIHDKINTNLFYSVDSQGDSVWVGSGDGLARTTDTLVSPWVGKWKIFRAYHNIASLSETYAAPNPFSPDDEVCRIFFKTGKPTASVTIKIFDFAMFPVRTVIQNASRSTGDVIWTSWDGKRDDGSQVANGVYFYRIQIDKDETVWGKILVLQ